MMESMEKGKITMRRRVIGLNEHHRGSACRSDGKQAAQVQGMFHTLFIFGF